VPQNTVGWVVIGLGTIALIFIITGLISILIPGDAIFSHVFAIPLSAGSVVSGIGALRKKYHTWQVWLGLGLGLIPMLFRKAFLIGELLYPH